ncbi:MAG: helix-turn-helix domain-containing protein [Actinomycetota bacterium]|nr:helix-turn-helix domain-containing protein [Actinomycetota bacterium]
MTYLVTEEVAEMTRNDPETVRTWRTRGLGPRWFRLPGTRRVLYAREDVEAWIASARQEAS